MEKAVVLHNVGQSAYVIVGSKELNISLLCLQKNGYSYNALFESYGIICFTVISESYEGIQSSDIPRTFRQQSFLRANSRLNATWNTTRCIKAANSLHHLPKRLPYTSRYT